ncbi:MAG: gliding motility-associated C-terminal domain-containing protein [Bacteroidia bacterium]
MLLLLFIHRNAEATHIVGGSISLKYISGNTYQLTLKVLRDCYNAQAAFDGMTGGPGSSPCIIGMFDLGTHGRRQVIDMGAPTVVKLKLSGPECSDEPDVCTELGTYTKLINFSPATYNSNAGYYFVYQRCCRNKIIQNIVSPNAAAIAIYAEVPPFGAYNSTPEFTSNPFTYLCKDNPYTYNMNFVETDGDSLHYSLITPLNGLLDQNQPATTDPEAGPYPTIAWQPGFDDTKEIRGSPALSIHPITGQLTVTPTEVGVFVGAIRVEEFRFGKKLGEVRLELQFSVTNCLSNPFPAVLYKNLDGTFASGSYAVHIPEKVCFNINLSDFTDSLYVKISGNAFNNPNIQQRPTIDSPFSFSGFKNGSTRFCWQTDCSLTGLPIQFFNVEVRDNGCPVPKITKSTFSVRIDSMPSTKPKIWFRNEAGDSSEIGNFTVRIPDELCLDILVADPGDSIKVKINGNAFANPAYTTHPGLNTPFSFEAFEQGQSQLCWKTDCSQTGKSYNAFEVQVTDNGCFPTYHSAPLVIHIDSMPLVDPVGILCMTLVNNNQTRIEFADSTYINPYYRSYHAYRAVDGGTFALIDSIKPQAERSILTDYTSFNNRITNYSYLIRTENLCRVEGPSSETTETASNLKPTPEQQKMLNVTVVDNKAIQMIWPKTKEKDFARYYIYKSKRGNDNFSELADYFQTGDTSFTDYQVDVQRYSYCYHVIMKDTCQNYGPAGQIACSILLDGVSVPFESHVNWTPYTYWDNGTKCYTLYKGDNLRPFEKLDNTDNTVVEFNDNKLNTKAGKFYYYVTANQENPLILDGDYDNSAIPVLYSQSNQIELIQSPLLHVPNAFTVNQDGVNDEWSIRDVFVKDYELRVYNKWGQLIFQTNDKNVHWKGETNDGREAPADVYVYLVSYTGWDQSTYYDSGNVTILR